VINYSEEYFGYKKKSLFLFSKTTLMDNLLLCSFTLRKKIKRKDPVYLEVEDYETPGRYITYKWDGENMRITNF